MQNNTHAAIDSEAYSRALEWLYAQAPAFHKMGAHAYKPGLERVSELARLLGNPHLNYRTIHIAGTNGKGSTAHSLAAVLQRAGYRTGLFTSPHLVDFRERIRVDGQMISRQGVLSFLERARADIERLEPSFFEITTMMAFDWFARQTVDVAVIETGLGGRLDSTNIISPELCVITSISLDHTEQLGDTLEQIAGEKAGIIKSGVAGGVVVSGKPGPEVADVFRRAGRDKGVPVEFADISGVFTAHGPCPRGLWYDTRSFGRVECDLAGDCQPTNMAGVLLACEKLGLQGEAVRQGLADVCGLTGLAGRWTILERDPLTVIDTGHNSGGWESLAGQISRCPGPRRLVVSFVADKDLGHVFDSMRTIDDCSLLCVASSTPRSMDACELARRANAAGLQAEACASLHEALARARASQPGLLFIGGSNFLVGDYLRARGEGQL